MAPVRRYLRISKYSVLECRIYVDNPAQVQSWLLHPRKPILPRVIESIRPLVLPKLREERERERSKKKSTKKKSVKDVIVKDDFEVSMFLTETSTRHSILTKHKYFRDKDHAKLQSNSNRLTADVANGPIDVDAMPDAPIRREDSDNEDVRLRDIPQAPAKRHAKRRRDETRATSEPGSSGEQSAHEAIELDSEDEAPPEKRRRAVGDELEEDADDDKKKMAMDVSYEGFSIYGKVLCLVVKRRDVKTQIPAGMQSSNARSNQGTSANGQAKMENWITSTQLPPGEDFAEV